MHAAPTPRDETAPSGYGVSVVRSGGQTGVDRAALDTARDLGIAIAGWCPRGGWAEDLPDPPGLLGEYPELTQTPSDDVEQRTVWNVRDADGTLIVVAPRTVSSPGTDATRRAAVELGRPVFLIDGDDVTLARAWLSSLPTGPTLNVAGPRESEAPGSYARARTLLGRLLRGG